MTFPFICSFVVLDACLRCLYSSRRLENDFSELAEPGSGSNRVVEATT
jgi:hypothetical protein